MKSSTIRELNQLNQRFYRKIAEDFHETRQYYWHGWRLLLPHIERLAAKKRPIRVLDIGCGNGRFAHFLHDTLESRPCVYIGTDNNQKLLDHARDSLSKKKILHTLHRIDLVEILLSDNQLAEILQESEPFDLVVMFGILHHIPSYQLRKQLLLAMSELLADQGLLCTTLWRFLDHEKAQEKIVPPNEMGITEEDLEPHDYLVTWDRGKHAVRYCHYTPEYEEERLVHAIHLPLIDQFESDGKEGRGNKYLIFQKLL